MVGMLILLLMTGCAGPGGPDPGVAESMEPGAPDDAEIDWSSPAPAATWVERGERFAIVTMGSSSCPPIATAITADGVDRILVRFAPSPHDPCTADMAATTHTFAVPEGVEPSSVTVEVSYEDWPNVHRLTLE
jgi:hypothetical protein